jgi:hypothetical protein
MENEQQIGEYRANDGDALVGELFSGVIGPSQRTESNGLNRQ